MNKPFRQQKIYEIYEDCEYPLEVLIMDLVNEAEKSDYDGDYILCQYVDDGEKSYTVNKELLESVLGNKEEAVKKAIKQHIHYNE